MGSGGPDLLNWLRIRGNTFEAKGLERDDVYTKRIRAKEGVPALLLEEDTRKTAHTLSKGVGGHYESSSVHGTDSRTFNSILTVFGRIKQAGKQLQFELRRIFFHTCDGNHLIVGSLTGLLVS